MPPVSTSVSSADLNMSVDEVKATIRQGVEASDQAKQLLESVRDRVCQAQALAQTTTHNSQHEAVVRGMGLIAEAVREITLTQRRIAGGASAVERYVKALL